METDQDRPRTRAWRSRAFVQPLLITVVGVVAPIALPVALAMATNRSEPCTGSSCAYIDFSAIIRGLLLYALCLLITGIVVGLSSQDSGLAARAILIVVATVSLTAFAVSLVSDSRTKDLLYLRDLVGSCVAVAISLLVPIGLGFGIGRAVIGARRHE